MSKPPTILEKIYAQRAQDVELAKQTPGTTPKDISNLLSMHLAPPLIPFVERLRRNPGNGPGDIQTSVSLMAEIKRASPSKGAIALTTPVAAQASTYALAGASTISVLTEPHWFKGSLHDMLMVRQSISSISDRPAVLRKEFILDEYQIAEARLYGADTVLLIVAMLNDERLERLYKYSLSLGMEPLVEVNNADEMRRALALGAKVIGVNNRNLHDFNVDMGTTSRLVDMVKERDVILCALSGISTPQDVHTYKEQGVKAVLVGESLMRANDVGSFIRELLDWPNHPHSEFQDDPIIMASGVTTSEQAQRLAAAGAAMLGLRFDPTLANSATMEQAKGIRNVFPKTSIISMPTSLQPSNTPWFHAHLHSILLHCNKKRPLLVGQFTTHVSHTLAFILEVIAAASLDLVQFDAAIPADWARFMPVPVIRRFASPLSSQVDQSAIGTAATDAAIIPGVNDASQINRTGLHSFALVDLTVANGSIAVYIPSQNHSEAVILNPVENAVDQTFSLVAKGKDTISSNPGRALKGVGATKKLVSAGGLGGKWPMPIMVTAGREQIKIEVIKELGAWGVEVDVDDNIVGLEEYFKSLQVN